MKSSCKSGTATTTAAAAAAREGAQLHAVLLAVGYTTQRRQTTATKPRLTAVAVAAVVAIRTAVVVGLPSTTSLNRARRTTSNSTDDDDDEAICEQNAEQRPLPLMHTNHVGSAALLLPTESFEASVTTTNHNQSSHGGTSIAVCGSESGFVTVGRVLRSGGTPPSSDSLWSHCSSSAQHSSPTHRHRSTTNETKKNRHANHSTGDGGAPNNSVAPPRSAATIHSGNNVLLTEWRVHRICTFPCC